MNQRSLFAGAVRTEWIKFRSAPVVIVTTILLVAGVPGIAAAAIAAALGQGPAAMKAAAFVGDGGLDGFLATAGQVSAAAGLLAFGVVYGWCFGREFTDGTIVALFAQPTTPSMVAGAKLIILGIWSLCCALVLTGLSVALGLLLGLHSTAQTTPLAVRVLLVTVLTAALATCCGLVAGLARSVMAPIGTAVVLIVVAQFSALTGLGGWTPFAAPGVWAASSVVTPGGQVSMQLLVVVLLAVVVAVATMVTWRRIRL